MKRKVQSGLAALVGAASAAVAGIASAAPISMTAAVQAQTDQSITDVQGAGTAIIGVVLAIAAVSWIRRVIR